MTGKPAQFSSPCGSGCSRCATGAGGPQPGELSGWRLVLSAVGMFLAPLGLALTGALAYPDAAAGQFLGCVGGLIAGVALAIVVARILRRPCKEAA